MKRKAKKKEMRQYIAMAFQLVLGAGCGLVIAGFLDTLDWGMSPGKTLMACGVVFLALYAAMAVQILIHESGHLVFGLLSGYRFCSFRAFSFMWLKEDGHIRMRKFSLPGTGGQCLMSPPDMKDGKLPVALYNLGGSLMNLFSALVCGLLSLAFGGSPVISGIALIFAVIGCMFAIVNGVPMRMGTVDNDGYNAYALSRNPEALRAFWVQLKVNEQIGKGVRLKDMPDKWFAVPGDAAMKNSMVATLGVFACNRLMDAHRFPEADSLMAHMLEMDSGMVGLHRNLLICDRIYGELIGENRREVLDAMVTKEQKKFMKQMKDYPGVLRTAYALALLGERDAAKAEAIRERFAARARTYPYPSEIQSEQELMQIAGALPTGS